jgi:integrase
MGGKQIKCSVATDNLLEARRKIGALRSELKRVDPEAGRVSVTRLCDRFLEAMASQAPKTMLRKKLIVERIRSKWKGAPARKIDKSAILTWLSSFDFSAPSYNLHLQTVRAVFRLGVEDRLLATSPVEGIRQQKLKRPIRLTPSMEQFRAVVESIRTQPFSDTAEESADFVEFLGLSGLGLAEAASLKWQQVDFGRGHILVQRQKTGQGFAPLSSPEAPAREAAPPGHLARP